MPILLKKPTYGKLIKGRDHTIRCTMVWDDNEPLKISRDVDNIYLTLKSSALLPDNKAEIFLTFKDNRDRFTILDDDNGVFEVTITEHDQEKIVTGMQKYTLDITVITTDGKEWPYLYDNNIMFTKSADI